MLLCSPSSISAHNLSRNRTRPSPINSMAVDRSSSRVATTAPQRRNGTSALEARISLVIALASQTSSLSQKLLTELAGETAKYVFSKRIFENRTLEEALMSVPDLETVKFNVLKRSDLYEIRQVELGQTGYYSPSWAAEEVFALFILRKLNTGVRLERYTED